MKNVDVRSVRWSLITYLARQTSLEMFMTLSTAISTNIDADWFGCFLQKKLLTKVKYRNYYISTSFAVTLLKAMKRR